MGARTKNWRAPARGAGAAAAFIAAILAASVSACRSSEEREAAARGVTTGSTARFDPFPPHAAELDGRTIVLSDAGVVLSEEEALSDVRSVAAVLDAFGAELIPYMEPGRALRTLVVLDPGLVGEESGLPTPGVCHTASRTVVLNLGLWREYSEAEREVVLYHELGHCELGRRHTEGRRVSGGPVSLMNRGSVRDARYFVAERTHYVRELFETEQAPASVRRGLPSPASSPSPFFPASP